MNLIRTEFYLGCHLLQLSLQRLTVQPILPISMHSAQRTLSSSPLIDLFCSCNQAFAKLPGHLVANVTSDKVLLTEVLENHIVFGKRLDNVFEEKDVVMKNIAGWTLRVNLYRQSKFYQVRIEIYF